MLSAPPATIRSLSPARMAWAANITALSPEPPTGERHQPSRPSFGIWFPPPRLGRPGEPNRSFHYTEGGPGQSSPVEAPARPGGDPRPAHFSRHNQLPDRGDDSGASNQSMI